MMKTLETIGEKAYEWSKIEPHLFQHSAYYAKQDLQYAIDQLAKRSCK